MMVIDDGCNIKDFNILNHSVHKNHINIYTQPHTTHHTPNKEQTKTSKTPTMHTQSPKPATKHTKQQPASTSPKHPTQTLPA